MSYVNRPLNRQDYKTLTLAALGGALEFYDFIIFVFFAAVVGDNVPECRKTVSYRKIKTDGQGNEPRDLHKSAERDTGRRYCKCAYRNGEKTDYQIIGSPPVALRRIFHGITCFPANTAKDRIKAKDRKQLAVFSLKLLLF